MLDIPRLRNITIRQSSAILIHGLFIKEDPDGKVVVVTSDGKEHRGVPINDGRHTNV